MKGNRRQEKKRPERKDFTQRGTARGDRKSDYTVYVLSGSEKAALAGISILLAASVAYLFYHSLIAFVLLLGLAFPVFREGKRSLFDGRQRLMRSRFLAGMELVTMSLKTGYAVENAFREAYRELRRLYPEDDFIVVEFGHIVRGVDLNETIESMLIDLGERSGVGDIRSFAEVFAAAKRTGGDLIAVIRNTVVSMQQKEETIREIETELAGKQLERRIMCLAPILILAYVSLTSPESLEIMYTTGTGMAVMTVCLLVYAAAVLWSGRIMDIRI